MVCWFIKSLEFKRIVLCGNGYVKCNLVGVGGWGYRLASRLMEKGRKGGGGEGKGREGGEGKEEGRREGGRRGGGEGGRGEEGEGEGREGRVGWGRGGEGGEVEG